jgi:hypothetical protein
MRQNPRARVAHFSVPLLLAGLVLAGCAGTPEQPGSAGDGLGMTIAGDPIAAPGPVIGQGTVLQKEDGPAMLCLGAVAESYPPQCDGPEVIGWDWEVAELEETASGVTWGTYAVTGTWDGAALTQTDPAIPLALYDPMMQDPDPRTDPANPGDGTEESLAEIQDDLFSGFDGKASPWPILTAWPENGYLFITVAYDDGTIQSYFDGLYGPDTVAVQSALRDL